MGSAEQLAALRVDLAAAGDSPGALAALVERAYSILLPEAPAFAAALSLVATTASRPPGLGSSASGAKPRASPWGGFTGGGGARARAPVAATAGTTGGPAAPQWSWNDVRVLHAYGLGSLSEYSADAASLSPADQSSSGQPKRGSMRLGQWALVLLLHRRLLPGPLNAQPRVADPAFSATDLETLALLGLDGHSSERLQSVTEPTLVYAPCCPRDVYSDLIGANWSCKQLAHMALISTSLSSQGDSSSLVAALTGSAGGASPNSSSSSGSDELHSLLHARGAVVEVLLPDIGGAHGIGTSVHLFPREQLLRAGVPP